MVLIATSSHKFTGLLLLATVIPRKLSGRSCESVPHGQAHEFVHLCVVDETRRVEVIGRNPLLDMALDGTGHCEFPEGGSRQVATQGRMWFDSALLRASRNARSDAG